MTTTLTTTFVTTTNTAAVTGTRPLWRAALACGAVAATATTAIAAVAHAAGVSFEIDGEAIPLMGFAQMTVLGAVLGLVIAVLCRRAVHPRATFVRVTVALDRAVGRPRLHDVVRRGQSGRPRALPRDRRGHHRAGPGPPPARRALTDPINSHRSRGGLA